LRGLWRLLLRCGKRLLFKEISRFYNFRYNLTKGEI